MDPEGFNIQSLAASFTQSQKGSFKMAPLTMPEYEAMQREMEELKLRGAALEGQVHVAEERARDAKAREEQATARVEELGNRLVAAEAASTADVSVAETAKRLEAENKDLQAINKERAAMIVQLEQDNGRLQQAAASSQVDTQQQVNVQQLEHRITELTENERKLEAEVEQLKLAAQSQPTPASDESVSPEVVQDLKKRIAELETRIKDSETNAKIEKNRAKAVDKMLLEEQEKVVKLEEQAVKEQEKIKRREKEMNKEMAHLQATLRKVEGRETELQHELKLKKQQWEDASNAVRHLEQKLREARANPNATVPDSPATPEPELMDVDGPPELPSPLSSPVTGPIEVGDVRVRNRRLSQHNTTLRAGQTKLEQDVQMLRSEIERLQAENARYEPFVETSEQRDGELEKLTEENASLARSNKRLREQREELRTLRDRGLLQDLKSATPDGLVPSNELTDMLAKNMVNVFAGLDTVLAETTQRKFTIVDRTPQPAPASLGRRTSMAFKQPTRPSTPAFTQTGSASTQISSSTSHSASIGWPSTSGAGTGWS